MDETSVQDTIGESERWLSVILGGMLILSSLRRSPRVGALVALGGSALVYRGIAGHDGFFAEIRDALIGAGIEG